MKAIKRSVLVCAFLGMIAFAATANAGTVKVFVQYLGGNLANPSETQQASYAAFLADNNIDFGVFYGPTSASGFGLTAAGYSTEYEYKSGMTKGGRVLVYKTSDWDVAQHDAAENRGTAKYQNWCSAYIVERKSNGERFYVVMFTGDRFDRSSYLTYGGYLSDRANLGPWLLVALPYNGALYTSSSFSSMVASNLSSGYTQVPNVSGTGAVFARNHTTLAASGSSVSQSTLGFGGEPAAVATVTYQRSLTVTFNDYDGTTIDTSTVLEGNDATPPADPTRTGYTFTGWSDSYLNVVMAGSAVATNGGQAGLLIGGRDTNSQYDTAFTAEASSVLASNAALPHYYDKDNAPASLATAPAASAPRALRNGMAKKQLDRAAQSNGWMRWIQGRFCPELVLFGTQGAIGLNVAIK